MVHISLKNFLLLWMILDDIAWLMELTKPEKASIIK